MKQDYTAEKIFTGIEWIYNQAIITEEKIIADIIPASAIPTQIPITHFEKSIIAPAFIDLQIYGASGKLFSVFPETDALDKLKDYCEKGGAAYCMPTAATNTIEVFYRCIDAIREYWSNGGEGILGLHLEGPWINSIKRGAHIESLIHSPTIKEVTDLLNYGKGVVKIITLAPEVCSEEVIGLILSHDIIISAGHSNATYQEAQTGFKNGITTVTHLYNAMSALQHRQPGLAGAVMDDDKIFSSIIPDGHHVDFAAIRIAKKIMKERLFVITDAVTATDKGPYPHEMEGDKYVASGILSGSALTMNKAVKNLVEHVGIDLEEALRMCSLYPAQVMKFENKLGKIAVGYNADMVVLNKDLDTISVLRH